MKVNRETLHSFTYSFIQEIFKEDLEYTGLCNRCLACKDEEDVVLGYLVMWRRWVSRVLLMEGGKGCSGQPGELPLGKVSRRRSLSSQDLKNELAFAKTRMEETRWIGNSRCRTGM